MSNVPGSPKGTQQGIIARFFSNCFGVVLFIVLWLVFHSLIFRGCG